MRRVAVTGMGVISPVGNDRSSFWNNLIAGKNGIGLLTRFDTSEQKVKVAAQVEDFDPVQYMERAQVRKTDLFAQYAMAAAVQAMQDARLCANENIQPERLGVYVGSGCGGINTITEQCSKFWESGPRHVSPFLIPMMIGNIASGNIAIRFRKVRICRSSPPVRPPPTPSGRHSVPSAMDMPMLLLQAERRQPSTRLVWLALQTAKR